jgi:hypothetical protein
VGQLRLSEDRPADVVAPDDVPAVERALTPPVPVDVDCGHRQAAEDDGPVSERAARGDEAERLGEQAVAQGGIGERRVGALPFGAPGRAARPAGAEVRRKSAVTIAPIE